MAVDLPHRLTHRQARRLALCFPAERELRRLADTGEITPETRLQLERSGQAAKGTAREYLRSLWRYLAEHGDRGPVVGWPPPDARDRDRDGVWP